MKVSETNVTREKLEHWLSLNGFNVLYLAKTEKKVEVFTRIRTSKKKKKEEENQAAPCRKWLEERFNALNSLINTFTHLTIQLTSWPSCLIFLKTSQLMNYIFFKHKR